MGDLSPKKIREAPIPSAFRGFDREATRDLLDRIATGYEALLAERDELRDRHATTSQPDDADEATKMTEMLLVAKRTADELVREAERRAEAVALSAENEGRRVLEAAVAEADARTAAARREFDALVRERDALHSKIAEARVAFTGLLRSALDTFEDADTADGEAGMASDLQARIATERPSG